MINLPRNIVLALSAFVLFAMTSPAQVLKGGRAYSPQWGGFVVENLNKELRLTPQQQTRIRPIVDNEQTEFGQIRDHAGQKIQAVLEPAQQKRFKIGGPWAHGPVAAYQPQWGGFILQHLTQELKLTKDQQAKVGPILSQAQTEFQGAHRKAGAQISEVLNGDQQKKFQSISHTELQ
jgi:Spy/CpxP family protein refolding chaperone